MIPATSRHRLGRLARIAALSAVSFFAAAACVTTEPSATTVLNATVADGTSALITVENGRIELVKDASVTGVEIAAEVTCFGRDQAEADARLKSATLVATRGSDGQVRISVDLPKRSFLNDRQSDSTHVTVRAATLSGITATTSNGSIDVGAFSGQATLKTSNGSIDVIGHDGPVSASTSNGAITIEGAPSAVANTSNGRIAVRLGREGSVEAVTSNGAIEITGASTVVAETSNGRIEVTLGEGATGDVRLESSNGSVTLDLPKAWQGTVNAESGHGSVGMTGGVVTGKDGSKTMTIGDGAKAKATVETGSGRVTIRQSAR